LFVVLFCVVLQIFLSSVPLFFITNKQLTFYKERERERETERETDEDDDDEDVTTKKTKKKKRENV
jgi:hypothetical protein|tara:strand:+ start:93 stop:290 length:198 start_codon:yes stop_codon:yes gene_type:complete